MVECHRDSIGPPPDVRMVARWTLESSASISEPSFSLLLNKASQPSQPGIVNNGGDDGGSGDDNEDGKPVIDIDDDHPYLRVGCDEY